MCFFFFLKSFDPLIYFSSSRGRGRGRPLTRSKASKPPQKTIVVDDVCVFA